MKEPLSVRIARRTLPRPIRKFVKSLLPSADYFLKNVSGVIHVGAHVGQERDLYAQHGINVLWLEANPDIHKILSEAIKGYPKQRALQRLVADVEGKQYCFHISSNNGASSSLFALGAHKKLWPEVTFTKDLVLESTTLSLLVAGGEIDLAGYDALIMDTQGAELLVLRGAADILHRFSYIKSEAADFEVYEDCCKLVDLDDFLQAHDFKRVRTIRFAHKPGIGSCYDVVYLRRSLQS